MGYEPAAGHVHSLRWLDIGTVRDRLQYFIIRDVSDLRPDAGPGVAEC